MFVEEGGKDIDGQKIQICFNLSILFLARFGTHICWLVYPILDTALYIYISLMIYRIYFLRVFAQEFVGLLNPVLDSQHRATHNFTSCAPPSHASLKLQYPINEKYVYI